MDVDHRDRPARALAAAARSAGTRVELRLQYGVAGGGIFGWLAEQVGAPIVRGNVKRTLRQLKRAVEHEQIRAEARAARRATR